MAGGGGTTWSATNGATCLQNRANSYTWSIRPLSTNVNQFVSGNSVVADVDHSGNWNLGEDVSNSIVNINKRLTVDTSVTIGTSNDGIFRIATTSTGCLQTSAANSNAYYGSCGSGGGIGDPFSHAFAWLSATTSSMAIGTSTISNALSATLTMASSTAPQLSLSSGGGSANWVFRNAGGNLYFSTTTVAGTSTTTLPALSILSTGQVEIGKAGGTTAQPFLNIGPGAGDTSHTVDIWQPHSSVQNVVSLNQTTAGFNNFLQFQPAGANSTTNVNWIVGVNANSNNFSWSMWNGSSVVQRITLLNSGELGIGTTTPSRIAQMTLSTTSTPQLSLSYGAGSSQWVMRNDSANFSLATTTIAGTATSSQTALKIDTNGVLSLGNYANCTGTNALQVSSTQVVCGSVVSDARLKKDVKSVSNGLDVISRLNPVSYYWNDLSYFNTTDPREQYGFIAQDLEKVIPSAVGESPDGYKTADLTRIIPYLVDSVKTLAEAKGLAPVKRSAEENWQWIIIGLLVLWNLGLTRKLYKN